MGLSAKVQNRLTAFLTALQYATSCSLCSGIVSIAGLTYAVYRGHVFRTWYKIPIGDTLAAAGTIDVVIAVGAYNIEVAGLVSLGDTCDVDTYGSPDYDADGSVLPTVNFNLSPGMPTATTSMWLNPTINDVGTPARGQYFPSGKKEGTTALFEGGTTIAAAGSSILARLTNSSSNAARYGVEIWWREFR